MLDIPDVTLHATFHLPQLTGLATESCHLSPAGDAWLNEVAHHIFAYQFIVLLCMGQHVGTWPYNTHIANQHVPELRQLVNVGLTHEVTERELTWVVLGSLYPIAVCVHMHGTELIAIEVMSVETSTTLTEENRSWTLTFYDQHDDRQ